MADYQYKADGKLHTRYTQLLRCTPGQIDRVIAEMGGLGRVRTDSMDFGAIRHQMLEERARKTGKIPICIKAPADYIEHEFTTELVKDVVVHSRIDVANVKLQTIFDYKTVVDGKQGWQKIVDSYRHESKQRQLKFYAFQMGLHGVRITKGMFLCEIWNEERDTILGYKVVEFPITLSDMAAALAWVRPRIALLASVVAEPPKPRKKASLFA